MTGCHGEGDRRLDARHYSARVGTLIEAAGHALSSRADLQRRRLHAESWNSLPLRRGEWLAESGGSSLRPEVDGRILVRTRTTPTAPPGSDSQTYVEDKARRKWLR